MEKMLRNNQVKRRVLVVDDEMINREILGNILHADYDVVYAGNGQQAIDILKSDSGSFSLILLDLLMPVLSGARVLDICRSDPELSGIPIIVMTQEEEGQLLWGLGEAKKANLSMDDVLALVPSYYDLLHPSHPNVTQQEVIDYIRNNWSSI